MAGLLGDNGDAFGGDLGLLGASMMAGQSPFAGVNIGNAFLQAMQLKQAQREQALKAAMLRQQIESGGLDLQQKKQTIADQDQLRQAMQSFAPAQNTPGPQTPVGQNFMGANPAFPQVLPGGGKSPAIGAPQTNSRSAIADQYDALASRIERQGTPVAMAQAEKYREIALKMRPKLKDEQVRLQNGTPVVVRNYEDGTTEVSPFNPTADTQFLNTGGAQTAINKYTGLPTGQSIANSVSPDEVYKGGVTMRGQNMTDLRQRELNAITKQGQNQQVLETANGPVLVDKTSSTASPITQQGAPIPGEAQLKKQVNAKGVLDLLGDAKKIIPTATNSLIGTGADYASRAFGHATEGDTSIAQLKAIQGALLMQMPRMEGPQSDKDVRNYQQAAGMLGDPTIPRALKLAAIDEIERIQKRYAGIGQPQNQASSGKVRRFNPDTGKIE